MRVPVRWGQSPQGQWTRVACLFLWACAAIACRPSGPLVEMSRAIDRLAVRGAETAGRAAEFDQNTALRSLGPGLDNGTCFRLDSRLSAATYQGDAAQPNRGITPLFELDFNDSEAPGVVAVASGDVRSPLDWYIADGSLVVRFFGKAYFDTGPVLTVPRQEIGDLVLRLKPGGDSYVRVSLEMDEGPDPIVVDVDVLPSDEFKTYRVALFEVLRGVAGSTVRRMTIDPWQNVGSVVEIDFVRLMPVAERFAREPFGTIHEVRSGEIRQTVFMNSPGALRFDVPSLPDGPLEFLIGVAVLRADPPVVISATLELADSPIGRSLWSMHGSPTPSPGTTFG